MKQIRHKQDKAIRVIQRGSKFYVQECTHKSSRETSGWDDMGHPRDTQAEAVAAMYYRVPLINKAA